MDSDVQRSDFADAAETLDKARKGGARLYPKKNNILLYLDRGQLNHYAQQYKSSARDLEQADKLIEDAFTKSIGAGVASYILNDNVKDYSGEDYENIYLNVFNALNYYYMGSLDDALVEVRKTNEKLKVLASEYEKINQQLISTYKSNLDNVKLPKPKSVNFSNSALADYLGALFYRAEGARDDARINLIQLKNAFITSPNVYTNPVPAELALSGEEGDESAEELTVPANKARLNFICFTGLSPVKKETVYSIPMPFDYGLDFANLRVPELAPRVDSITAIEIIINEKQSISLNVLEDMGKVVVETYNAKLSSVMLKTVIRTVVKYASVYVLAAAAEQASGSDGVGTLTALAAKITFDASERADTRMERYLPAKAWTGGVNLDPGSYNVVINYFSGKKKIAVEKKTIDAATGKLNLLEGVCLK